MASKNYQTNNELITRAGLAPNERELPYSITTSDVESYLQGKIDIVANRDGGSGVNVRVYTTEPSKTFLPFVVLLPLDVLESEGKKNKNQVPSIFNTSDDTGSANLKKPYYDVFSPYIYNKRDEGAFFADDWRRRCNISRETSPVLKSLRTPKVSSMENGNIRVVSFMIDPLRVFHDMLTIQNDNRSFKVAITGTQKIQTGEYRYDISRIVTKGKGGKKYRDTLANELNRKMRGNR